MPTIDEVIGKVVELRDRKAVLAKKQSEEMAPLNAAMDACENYLMHQMNELGVTQLKGENGTAFRATTTSVQMQDIVAFKEFVFRPVVDAIFSYLDSTGVEGLDKKDVYSVQNIVRDMVKWDMVDFRAGKKGITEFIANGEDTVPGVAINTMATVSVRRS